MPIYHQGRKVKEVYHQGRKVKEIWHMGRRIYTSFKPRVFTVKLAPGSLIQDPNWVSGSVTGDSTLVQSITGDGLYLAANATYTRTDGGGGLSANGVSVSPGEPVPAGVRLTGSAGTYVFTEMAEKPVEVMPTTPGELDARNWLRATVQKYGLSYQTVRQLPFDIDSRNATRMGEMFRHCSSLTSVPQMDTAQVTDMDYMFDNCSSLTTVPQMNTGNVTTFDYMFQRCSALTNGNATLTVKRKGATTRSMIVGSGLTREPFLTIE